MTSNRADVRDFLVTRRGRITPQQAGLSYYGGNRRVPGLRREEVAMLAGVSADYYTRLEKGNLAGVSDSVLEAIAGALQLSEAERLHLFDLARTANLSPARAARRRPAPEVRPGIRLILDGMNETPGLRPQRPPRHPRRQPAGTRAVLTAVRQPGQPAQPRPVQLLRSRRARFLSQLRRVRPHDRRTAANRGRPRPFQPVSDQPDRRPVDPQRGIPHPVGRSQRPPAPLRTQALPPPGRRRP
jgi:transcriptional regulator with XRE-family HTH domain